MTYPCGPARGSLPLVAKECVHTYQNSRSNIAGFRKFDTMYLEEVDCSV